jgi:hypothetical protein
MRHLCCLFGQYHCLGKTSFTRQSKLFRASDDEIEQMIIDCSAQIAAERQHRHARTLSQQRAHSLSENNMITGSPMRVSAHSGAVEVFREAADDPFAELASPDSWRYIQSQDSLAGDSWLGRELSRDAYSTLLARDGNGNGEGCAVLEKGDIIVDKMHIHYGKKHLNPVANMRFYTKGAGPDQVAKQVSEDVYQPLLPRTFEELAVRVFCRDPSKQRIAFKAFRRFCDTCNVHLPFPSQSQSEETAALPEDEEEGTAGAEGEGTGAPFQAVEVRQFAHISGARGNGW